MLPQQCSVTQQTQLNGIRQKLFIADHVFAGGVGAQLQIEARPAPHACSPPRPTATLVCVLMVMVGVQERWAEMLDTSSGLALNFWPVQTQHQWGGL